MSKEIAKTTDVNSLEVGAIERLISMGDVSKLSDEQKGQYYKGVCDSLGLNPLTRPFEYMTLNGKQTLYIRKYGTEQLRSINKVSIDSLESKEIGGVYIVTARGRTPDGRRDVGTGAVNILNLKGDALANAFMKAETKAKRRLTLSICGLGMLDESELETIPSETKRPIKDVKPAKPRTEKADNKIDTYIERIQTAASIAELKTVFTEAWPYAKQFKPDMLDELKRVSDARKEVLTEKEEPAPQVVNDEWTESYDNTVAL